MVKGFAVVIFWTIISLTYGDLGSITSAINKATGDTIPALVREAKDSDLQSIKLPVVGNVGMIALPVDLLCRIPGVNDYSICYLCNVDCFFVHNKFGGTCGPHPNKPGECTCLCAETRKEADARGIHISSKETCKQFLPKLPSPVAEVDDFALKEVLRSRLASLLCPTYANGTYEQSGCRTDCEANHGIKGGLCTVTRPKDKRLGNELARYCECE